jgi:hypothetical protein
MTTPTDVQIPPIPGKLFEQVIVTDAARQGYALFAE